MFITITIYFYKSNLLFALLIVSYFISRFPALLGHCALLTYPVKRLPNSSTLCTIQYDSIQYGTVTTTVSPVTHFYQQFCEV